MSQLTWTAFRVVIGALFLCHGADKLFGWPGVFPQPAVGSQVWIGGVIELVCGALVAIGLFARPAAFLASGTMAVAFFQMHFKVSSLKGVLPISNGGEAAVLFCFAFLVIAASGAGPHSIDGRRGRV